MLETPPRLLPFEFWRLLQSERLRRKYGIVDTHRRSDDQKDIRMRWLKRIVLGLVGLAALIACILGILAIVTNLPGEEKTPARIRRDTALYTKMRDGVPITVDVCLPQNYQARQRLPALT